MLFSWSMTGSIALFLTSPLSFLLSFSNRSMSNNDNKTLVVSVVSPKLESLCNEPCHSWIHTLPSISYFWIISSFVTIFFLIVSHTDEQSWVKWGISCSILLRVPYRHTSVLNSFMDRDSDVWNVWHIEISPPPPHPPTPIPSFCVDRLVGLSVNIS